MLTELQEKMVQYIEDHLEVHWYPPSIREIGASVGVSSTSTIRRNLAALELKGYIEHIPEIARAIKLLKTASGGVPEGQVDRHLSDLVEWLRIGYRFTGDQYAALIEIYEEAIPPPAFTVQGIIVVATKEVKPTLEFTFE